MMPQFGIAVVACALVVGCKDKPTPRSSAPPSVRGDAAAVIDTAEEFDSVAEAWVAKAFGGAAMVPGLPLLSKDGALAAVDVSVGPDGAHFTSYEVGFLDTKGAIQSQTVLTLAQAIALETDEGARPDPALLATAAGVLAARLAVGGFTELDTPIDDVEPDATSIPLGSAGTLEIKQPPEDAPPGTGSLTLRLVDARGTQLAREVVPATKPRKGEAAACGAAPRLGQVWFDAARRRVLISIGYVTGGDTCKELAGAYRLWVL